MGFHTARSFGSHRFGAILMAALLLVAVLPGAVLAVTTVNSATGGGAISADTTGGSYTALSGPSITVTAADDIDPGTITITAPAGFEFDAGATPSVGVGTTGAVIGLTSDSSSVITFTVTTGNTAAGTVTFSGVAVRPTAGTPLATGELQVGGTAGVSDATAGTLTEVAGAPTVQFMNSMGDAAAGALLSPQPLIHAADQFGNDSYSVALSIKPGTGTPGATVVCSPVSPINTNASGDAQFAGCHIDTTGTGYRLLATVAGVTAESNLFNITAGAAAKLVMTVQPNNATLADAFPLQPVVEVQDASGNRVTTDDTTSVTLGLTTGTGTLTCTGGLSKTVTDGRATFSGCSIDTVGLGKVITASSSPVFTPDATDPFDVSDRLVFNPNPSSTAGAGVAFAVQPKVEVRAGATTVAVNDDVTVVTLAIKAGTGAAGAVLACDGGLSKTVVNGVATFAGCKIDKISPTSPANPYKIVATATNLTSAESTNVTITAGSATKLGFTAQPNGGVASQAFPIQPVVAVQDAGGNTVTSGTNSTATVTLSLGAGSPAGAVLTCTGGLAKAAVAGVATFTGCMVNAAGTYTLVATASNLAASTTVTSATSAQFVVTAPGATITLTTSAPTPPGAQNPVILWGQGFTLTVQFGTNGANKQFQLQGTRDGTTWTTITTLTTDVNGRASLFYTPVTNLWYRAVFAGSPDLAAANSNQVRTVVRQLALLRPTNHGAIRTINRNTSIQFTTTVRPARPELAPATVTFTFYRFSSGAWRLVTSRNVVIDSAGLARTTFQFTSSGQWYVRSQANPTTYNANSVNSPVERYSVR